MEKDKRLQYKVTSTENHSELFTSRREAEKYIRQLYKEKRVGAFVEFRIYEIGVEK